jgi:hypothetical protein
MKRAQRDAKRRRIAAEQKRMRKAKRQPAAAAPPNTPEPEDHAAADAAAAAELARFEADVAVVAQGLRDQSAAITEPMHDAIDNYVARIAGLRADLAPFLAILSDLDATPERATAATEVITEITRRIAMLEKLALGIEKQLRNDEVDVQRQAVRHVTLVRRKEREAMRHARTQSRTRNADLRDNARTKERLLRSSLKIVNLKAKGASFVAADPELVAELVLARDAKRATG